MEFGLPYSKPNKILNEKKKNVVKHWKCKNYDEKRFSHFVIHFLQLKLIMGFEQKRMEKRLYCFLNCYRKLNFNYIINMLAPL